jgi:hypothetical protein
LDQPVWSGVVARVSDKPAYLETWSLREDGLIDDGADREHGLSVEQKRLVAAAPALVRALLMVEWGMLEYEDSEPGNGECPACGMPEAARHENWCDIDRALVQAGFAIQAEREGARSKILEMKP